MSTTIEISPKEPTVIMSRIYDATRNLVWAAMTEPRHVRQWWGGRGCTNPVCEMDLRPGGLWTQVMRFADGHELNLSFVFVEIEPPKRLVWEDIGYAKQHDGAPIRISVTLDDLSRSRTQWRMVARFHSLAARDAAVSMGFSGPIEASNAQLTDYLTTLSGAA